MHKGLDMFRVDNATCDSFLGKISAGNNAERGSWPKFQAEHREEVKRL